MAVSEASKALRAFGRASRGIDSALTRIGLSADRTSVQFDASMASVSTSVTSAAARVDTASGTMVDSLRAVSAQARSTAASVAAVGRSRMPSAVQRDSAGAGTASAGAGALTPGAIGGLVALGTLGTGVSNAANFEQAATQAALAMGLPTDQVMQNFRPVAMQMSTATAQSTTDTMKMIQAISTSGFNDPRELLANNAALPMTLARYADTQFLGIHNVAFQDSITQGATLAHQLGTRSPQALEGMLNTLWKISQDMPDNIRTAQNQIKYFGGAYVNAGVSPSEVLQLQAAADRMGLGGGRSGTGFRALLATLENPSTKQFAAQQKLGLIGPGGTDRFINHATGVFDVKGLFKSLNAQYDAARKNGTVGEINATLAGISTAGAAPILNAFSSDAGQQQQAAVAATLVRVEDLQAAQVQLIGNLNGQTKLLTSNFATLTGVIASPFIKPLTAAVSTVANAFGNLATFLSKHPFTDLVIGAGVGVLALRGIAALAELIGGITIIARAAAHDASKTLGIVEHFHWPHGPGGHPSPSFLKPGENAAPTVAKAAKGGIIELLSHGFSGLVDGILGSLKGGIKGLFTLSGLRQLIPEIRTFASDVKFLGLEAITTRAGIQLLAGSIFRFGLALASGVGEILFVVQGLTLLRDHSKDIGKALGDAAFWITDKGGPMLVNAFQGAISGLVNWLTNDAFTPGKIIAMLTKSYNSVLPPVIGYSIGQSLMQQWLLRDRQEHPQHAWSEQEGYGPNWHRHGRSMRVPMATGLPRPAVLSVHGPRHAATDHRHAAITHNGKPLAYVPMGERGITIHNLTVNAAKGDDLGNLLDSVEAHVNSGHVGLNTPRTSGVRAGVTPGGIHYGIS